MVTLITGSCTAELAASSVKYVCHVKYAFVPKAMAAAAAVCSCSDSLLERVLRT
jgi:hypothetical protein